MADFGQRRAQRGVTLVELVLAIVIISIAVTGVLAAYVTMVSRSADPLLAVQATAVAEAYMDEILSKPLTGGSGSCDPRTACRAANDYNGLSGAPADQFGDSLGLSGYNVVVSVGSEPLGGLQMIVVQVTVTYASGSVQLRSHRVDF